MSVLKSNRVVYLVWDKSKISVMSGLLGKTRVHPQLFMWVKRRVSSSGRIISSPYLFFFSSRFLFSYYRFNEASQTVDDGYPKSISVWQGVPDNIKSAFMSKDQGKGGMCQII